MAADIHDNRATVELGGSKYELAASKLAERIYGDRFRDDLDQLGRSGLYAKEEVKTTDDDGNEVTSIVRSELHYTGRLKTDVALSSVTNVSAMGDIPTQVHAAAWAMARAAGSTALSWDEWIAELPSNADEDVALFEAVCVDLSERAFFRKREGRSDAGEPDEGNRRG